MFATSLPRLPSKPDIIVVRKETSHQSHHDFHVRRAVVDQALQWLIAHNIYYRANHVHFDREALAHLPQDGCLTNIRSVVLDSSTSVDPDSSTSEDLYAAHLPQSFVPSTAPSMTEQEAVCYSVQ